MTTRILIADDHELMRKALVRLLESHLDWEVCGEAENGVETVRKAIELKPDLIILDLAMPLLDGLHAAREITATYPDTTIVAHTIYAVPEITEVAESCGVRKVVAKGTPKNELFKPSKERSVRKLQRSTEKLLKYGFGCSASNLITAQGNTPGGS